MNLLICAAACSPYHGSEASIGWKVSTSLARNNRVTVVTLAGFMPELEKARKEGLVPKKLDFVPLGRSWDRLPAPDVEKKYWWSAYREFLSKLGPCVRSLHAESHFDLVHHLTFATWRLPVSLHDLGVPFVWGPVGGAERFPPGLLGILSPAAATFELVRYAGNFVGGLSPGLRRMVRGADAVIASNPDAARLLNKIRGGDGGIHELLVTSFTPQEREALGTATKPPRRDPEVIHAFASGALEGRKGVSLALEAIALAKKEGLRIRYRVGSHGPEIHHLREKASKLGLDEEVLFGDPLPREDYVRELLESDVYLLPSLRDNAPSTLMEAMLAGCVPIVAACGGPDTIVADDCGFRVPVSSRDELVRRIAEALKSLQADPERLQGMGRAARARILGEYTMERYLERLDCIYQDAIDRHPGVSAG